MGGVREPSVIGTVIFSDAAFVAAFMAVLTGRNMISALKKIR